MLNGIDIAILIILLFAFIKGYRKGLVRMLIGLATIVLAAIFGGKLAAYLLPEINKFIDLSAQWSNVIAYLVAFLIIATVLSAVGTLIHRLFNAIHLSFLNRMSGGVVAVGSIMVVLSILLNLVLFVDTEEKLIKPEVKKRSFFYERVQAVVPAIVPFLDDDSLKKLIPDGLKRQIDKMDDEMQKSIQKSLIDSTFQQKYFETDSA